MNVGQLLVCENYETNVPMDSSELMDKKMDLRFEAQKVRNVQEILEDNDLPDCNSLPLKDQISLMDRISSLEYLFYDGTTLGLSIYSCYYLQEGCAAPSKDHLEAFFKSVLKSCHLVSFYAEKMAVCADEDMPMLDLYLPLLQKTPPSQILTLLQNSKEKLSQLVSQGDENKPFYEAILTRINLRYCWLSFHTVAQQGLSGGTKDSRKGLIRLKGAIEKVRETLKDEKLAGNFPEKAFEPKIVRRLAIPAHFREVQVPPFSKALDYMERFVNELEKGLELSPDSSFFEYLDFLIKNSWKSPLLLSRSYIMVPFPNQIFSLSYFFSIFCFGRTTCSTFLSSKKRRRSWLLI